MSYNKRVWKSGDRITKEALNNMENGIEAAHQNSGGTGTSYDDTAIKADIQTLKANEVNLVEDETSMEGIKDNEYPTLTTQDKTLIGGINEVDAQCKDIVNKTLTSLNTSRENSVVDFTTKNLVNKTFKSQSPSYGEIYNKMKYSEEWGYGWLNTEYANTNDIIEINNIRLTNINTNNFYKELKTGAADVGMGLEADKNYLCSAYCYTNGKPFFFYHQCESNTDNHATYCDNTLRRFWFIIKGNENPRWFVQGNSGYNLDGTGYSVNLYMGGFQVEEITNDVKNGIVVIGDSTVDGASGSGKDVMNNTEWVKFVGSLLNVDYYNRGIGGTTTTQMLNRWDSDITPLKDKCKYVIIQGGINDLANNDVDLIVNNHKAMHDKAVTDGLIPIHCTITPCNKEGDMENTRIEANNQLRTLYDNIIDLDELLKDIQYSNKIIQLDGWKGDDTHYGQKAKLYVANYIASLNWDFVVPKTYQKVYDNKYTIDINTTDFDIYKKGTTNLRAKIKEHYDGSILYLYDDSGNSVDLHYSYGTFYMEGNELCINPKSKAQYKNKHTFVGELIIPSTQPTTLSANQLYTVDGKLYITINNVAHEIQFVN